MEYLSVVFIPIVVAVLVGVVGYLFKVGLKEKTYDENAAEQKRKYGTKSKPKYLLQKKPVKPATKEKPSTEKKNKVTFQSPISKEIKKVEPLNTAVPNVDKIDGNVNAKKKTEKVQLKSVNPISNGSEKSQSSPTSSSNPSGKNTTVDHATNKINAIVPQEETNNAPEVTKKSNEKSVESSNNASCKNDNNNNIPVSKSNSGSESTDNEDTDSSYNNDRTNSVSYYNSNNTNGEKLLKNKPVTNTTNPSESKLETEAVQKQKPSTTEGTSAAKVQPQDKKKSKPEIEELKNGAKPSVKTDDKQPKDKSKKVEEKVKNSKEAPKDDKVKEKVPASPSKHKKADDKVKVDQVVVASSSSSLNSSPGAVEEKELKPNKNDKKVDAEKSPGSNAGQNGDKKISENEKDNVITNLVKPEKTQPHKKTSNASLGGKTSPVQNGKNHGTNISKITKKQASEVKTLQKLSDENDGPMNANLLIPLIAKAELSRFEIQNLIDLLLNKQQEDCIIDAEWIEGSRQDPMVKLKKQLAEKEKLLSAEQEAHQAMQSKLKELRAELNVEKHNNRQLEESLNVRQADFQLLKAKLQATLDEKQNFDKQIQQLQAKLNEERMIMHSLKEEYSKSKNSLQQELLSQRQQLESHIADLNEQHQRELGQMAAQLQEQEAANAQMNEELRDSVLLRDQIALRQTATATQELVIQLEKLQAIRAEQDRHLASRQYEVNQLGSELKSVTEQLSIRNVEIEKFNCTVQNMKIENQELLKENARINEQINSAFSEKKQLHEQLQQLKDQSRKLHEIDQLENELNKYKTFVNEKTTEITELNNQIAELKASLQQSVSRSAELEERNKVVEEIEDNFKKQLKKNDELRCKNWKAMEALSTMEKSFENKVKEIRNLSHEIKVKEREELIQRLESFLPASVELDSSISVAAEDNVWFDYVEKLLKEIRLQQKPAEQRQQQNSSPTEDKVIPEGGKVNMLFELEKQNNKLQSMVSHYKGIISDTEGMLNSLQKHVEHEENRWSEQVQVLESKLDVVAKERDSLLSKAKMQNGCVKDEENVNEHKLNCDNKHSSILSGDYSS